MGVWLLGVVVRRYIDLLILLIPTPLVSVLFCSSIPTFCSFFKCFFFNVSFFILYISGRTSCRKCKCFYVYLNIRPMSYEMQI